MTDQQITVTLDNNYVVSTSNGEIFQRLTSFAKIVEYLTNCVEFNSLGIEFSVVNETLKPRQMKQFTKRVNKLATALNMEVAFVENKEIGGYVCPLHFVGALV